MFLLPTFLLRKTSEGHCLCGDSVGLRFLCCNCSYAVVVGSGSSGSYLVSLLVSCLLNCLNDIYGQFVDILENAV